MITAQILYLTGSQKCGMISTMRTGSDGGSLPGRIGTEPRCGRANAPAIGVRAYLYPL